MTLSLSFLRIVSISILLISSPSAHSQGLDEKSQKAYEAGKELVSSKQLLAALDSFTSAISGDSSFTDAYCYRAFVHSSLKNNEESLADFKLCIGNLDNVKDLNKHDLVIANARVAEKVNDREAAYELYSKAIDLDNRSIVAYYKRGMLNYSEKKDAAAAIEDFDKCLDIDKSVGLGHYGKGYVLYVGGKLDESKPYLKKCVELKYKSSAAKRYLKVIENGGLIQKPAAKKPNIKKNELRKTAFVVLGTPSDIRNTASDSAQNINHTLKLYEEITILNKVKGKWLDTEYNKRRGYIKSYLVIDKISYNKVKDYVPKSNEFDRLPWARKNIYKLLLENGVQADGGFNLQGQNDGPWYFEDQVFSAFITRTKTPELVYVLTNKEKDKTKLLVMNKKGVFIHFNVPGTPKILIAKGMFTGITTPGYIKSKVSGDLEKYYLIYDGKKNKTMLSNDGILIMHSEAESTLHYYTKSEMQKHIQPLIKIKKR